MDDASGPMTGGRAPTCPACGGAATAAERFCRHCGGPLAASPEETVALPVTSEGERGRPPTSSDATTALPPTGRTPRAPARSSLGTGVAASWPCPACGGANDADREVCGACGADLDTGEALPRLTAQPLEEATPQNGSSDASHHRRFLLVSLGAGLAVVALIVAGLRFAGVGPFETEPELPEVAFDADWYGDELALVALSDVAALTTRPPQGTVVFTPAQMVDDDPTTAWNNDGAALPDGLGEKIDLYLTGPVWVQQVVVTNGDQRDAETYAANARLKRVLLTLDGGNHYILNLLDQGLQQQVVELPEPVLTTTVRLEVLETFPGDTDPHLAVADLALRGWEADDADAALAEERAEIRRAAGGADLPEIEADEAG